MNSREEKIKMCFVISYLFLDTQTQKVKVIGNKFGLSLFA